MKSSPRKTRGKKDLSYRFLRALASGDRRTVGAVDAVVRTVLRTPNSFNALCKLMEHADPRIRMRAADAVEKITRERPDLLHAHKKIILSLIAHTPQQEVQWHVAALIPRLPLRSDDMPTVRKILNRYLLETKSNIVRVMTLQAITDLALQGRMSREEAECAVRLCMEEIGTPSIIARGKKLLKQLME